MLNEETVEVLRIKEDWETGTRLRKEDIKTKQLSTIQTGFPRKIGSYPRFYVNALGG
jgi:hypothetical protein